jgi:heat shock protein HtpX
MNLGFVNTLKTWTLMAALAGILVVVGGLLGGQTGLVLALVFAVGMNGFVYWTSDSLALKANRARPLRPGEDPRLVGIVATLSQSAGIPTPPIYIVERPEPNAFATGRNPSHSAIAVTTGLLSIMDDNQLAGVLAHELSHIKNRDTLVGTIAATIAGAVAFLAQMAQFELFFGGGGGRNREGGMAGALAAMILAPMAAMIVQLAVSRGREYGADQSGAALTGDPESLAQALEKLDAMSRQQRANQRPVFGGWGGRRGGQRMPAPQPALNPAFAHLYIANPLAPSDLSSLFSTHPPIAQRVARLRAMRQNRLSNPVPRTW